MSKQTIPYIPSDLATGISHICCEYSQLLSAAYWSVHGDAPWRTHADNAFLIGYRKMSDFLLFTERSTKKVNGVRQELPDILALDYLPPGYLPTWSLKTWTLAWRDAMNRQLAHLSYDRNKRWDHLDWIPKLEEEFRDAWRLFIEDVQAQHKAEFERQIEIQRANVGHRISL